MMEYWRRKNRRKACVPLRLETSRLRISLDRTGCSKMGDNFFLRLLGGETLHIIEKPSAYS
ncbi:MAG: hypothetical protein HA496_00290 [Thaumarchaeota archaeon]|nr:hypothetical protein [Nitrososphaerota archaeon]